MFWDLSLAQYRTLDLQCPYQTIPETPAPATPSPPPKLPGTTKSKVYPPVVPKPEVFCYAHQMNVVLPSGPISEIVVKGVCRPVFGFRACYDDTAVLHMVAIISP